MGLTYSCHKQNPYLPSSPALIAKPPPVDVLLTHRVEWIVNSGSGFGITGADNEETIHHGQT